MWKQLRLVSVNVLLTVVVGVLWLVLRDSDPTELGFFCEDVSIAKPYHDSTVTSAMLYGVGYTIPAVIIFFTELYLQNGGDENEWRWRVSIQLRTIPSVLAVTVKTYLYFLFTTFSVGLVTNISKSICGRLRPNFLDVCRPDWTAVKCETADGRPNYVTDYSCLGNPTFGDEAIEEVTESRRSFISGHASFSFQTMMFCVLYLQARVYKMSHTTLFVPFLQLTFFCMAFATGLSRVTDNKHHPTDVLAGAFIGVLFQWFNVVYIMGLFKVKSKERVMNVPVPDNRDTSRSRNYTSKPSLDHEGHDDTRAA